MLDATRSVHGFFLQTQEPEREALVIQLWSKWWKVEVYRGSHLCRPLEHDAGDILLGVSTDQLPMKAEEIEIWRWRIIILSLGAL